MWEQKYKIILNIFVVFSFYSKEIFRILLFHKIQYIFLFTHNEILMICIGRAEGFFFIFIFWGDKIENCLLQIRKID